MIDSHGFGTMAIQGETYTSDLIIFPDNKIKDRWRRKSGHLLTFADIASLLEEKPEIIIAGTGVYGRMKIEKGLYPLLSKQGITLIALRNSKAVEEFNEKKKMNKNVGACFHLTC